MTAARRTLYLDHNATTFLHPEVAEAMYALHQEPWANPASQHEPGRRARRLLEDARERIADLLGANVRQFQGPSLIFTSGGTEANNLAILGQVPSTPSVLWSSPLEHASVAAPLAYLAQQGHTVQSLPVQSTGELDLDSLPALDGPPPPALACLMFANHETGVLQPVASLTARLAASGVPVHCDAVQAAGKWPLSFSELQVATLAFSAHKFRGPPGIGGLLVRSDVRLQPRTWGGFQQAGLRPGTEPLPLVVGMRVALELWHRDGAEQRQLLAACRDRLEARIRAAEPEACVQGTEAPRLPHVTNLSFPGLDRQAVVMALDLAGVAVSTGSACQSGSSEPSAVLLAMGCRAEVVKGAIRISWGVPCQVADADEAADRILAIVHDLRRRNEARKTRSSARQLGSQPL